MNSVKMLIKRFLTEIFVLLPKGTLETLEFKVAQQE